MIKEIFMFIVSIVLSVIFFSLMMVLSLFVPIEAQAADNDTLAFEFISTEPDILISVDECFERGYYTFDQSEKVKSDESIYIYNYDDFNDIGDFCQQVHEELYPREYGANKIIRGLVK